MIDAHCHLDAYRDPYAVAVQTDRDHVLTIAVTNLPSKFGLAYPHVRPLRSIRLAVGMHPLQAEQHAAERERFAACMKLTSFVGEVGLDLSTEGRATRDLQVDSFRYVLGLVHQQPKFLSIHSRRAEAMVLDLLEEVSVTPTAFHWYTGSRSNLDRLIAAGHYCSVNPAMIRSAAGRTVIERLPADRVLTETDGPHVQIGGRPAMPFDVALVEKFLADCWRKSRSEVAHQVRSNLLRTLSLVPPVGPLRGLDC